MTYVHKGFISNTVFANNTPTTVAVLGELSSRSSTYSREKGIYSNNTTAPDLVLTSFISKDDTTDIAIPAAISAQILEVAQYVYAQTLPGNLNVDPTVLLENLLTRFAGTAATFQCGLIINDGVNALPEWVSWQTSVDATRVDNFIKIWFVDQSFQQQYDEFEIYVVPPFTPIDNFFLSGNTVETAIAGITSSDKTDAIQAAKNGYPETIVRTNTFVYYDPLNTSHQVSTDWSVLIYGIAGDNVDSIKDAIVNYILANSVKTRDQWIVLLPDIFKRTEFILLPLWDQFAIPNRELTVGIYSPQVSLATAVAKMKQYATQYPEAHIDSNVQAMGHPYKSIAICSVGSPDNRLAQFQLSQVFPDLIAVTSTSVDFNRMSSLTQGWATLLANLLVAAESVTDFSVAPTGMMKVHRDGILYLTKAYQNINYLVVAKSNFA